jgi:predicted metal-dependent peptidase
VQKVERPGLGTLAVDDRWRLYFDPEVAVAWQPEELSAVVYHEVCHLLRDHAGRAAIAQDRLRWNLACDAEINDDLKSEGAPLPGEAIFPATFGLPDGLLAEEYYRRLLEREPGPCAAVPCSAAANGRCGSGVTGLKEEWELSGEASAAVHGAISAGEAALVRRQVAQAVTEHAKGRGTVPGHWERWAELTLEPVVDWRRELAGAVRNALAVVAGACDYSYRRPSRRQAGAGAIVLPALIRAVPSVAVVVDTSGSMGPNDLECALAEVAGIIRAAGQREGIRVLSVDAAVHSSQRVVRAGQVRLAGGGGTDMGAGLAAVEKLNPRPQVAIVITDGFTPWPDQPPAGIRTVVVLTGARGSSPAWAKTVWIKPEERR